MCNRGCCNYRCNNRCGRCGCGGWGNNCGGCGFGGCGNGFGCGFGWLPLILLFGCW